VVMSSLFAKKQYSQLNIRKRNKINCINKHYELVSLFAGKVCGTNCISAKNTLIVSLLASQRLVGHKICLSKSKIVDRPTHYVIYIAAFLSIIQSKYQRNITKLCVRSQRASKKIRIRFLWCSDSSDMVDEVLENIHHVWWHVVE